MFDAFAQTVIPEVISTAVPGEAQIQTVSGWLMSHTGLILAIGVPLMEVILRLWPTVNRGSMLSYAGKILRALGQLCWILSDLLSKIIPDRRVNPPLDAPK